MEVRGRLEEAIVVEGRGLLEVKLEEMGNVRVGVRRCDDRRSR